MIYTRLIGGLGNQMFQYACGLAVAEKLGVDLNPDIIAFQKYSLRQYELGIFNISAKIDKRDHPGFYNDVINRLGKQLNRLFFSEKKRIQQNIFAEDRFTYDPRIFTVPDGTMLKGYWQSEKYFINIENKIRNEFLFKEKPDKKNKQQIKNISNVESVSIHIRRGDYISDTQTNQVHGVCSLDYYKKAINYIAKKVTEPVFFIFSDEPEWAKTNLKLDFETVFISHNTGRKSYEDMRLMSQCKHNIIANSSFSWWGAWLNQNLDKIVIAPQKWFNDTSRNTKDLIPESWIKL